MPEIVLEGTRLDLVEQSRLLGIVVTSGLNWSSNTEYIAEWCCKEMWVIRQLKMLGASYSEANLSMLCLSGILA